MPTMPIKAATPELDNAEEQKCGGNQRDGQTQAKGGLIDIHVELLTLIIDRKTLPDTTLRQGLLKQPFTPRST